MASGFFQGGIVLGVVASVAIISWPKWKPDWELPSWSAQRLPLPGLSRQAEPQQTLLYTWTDEQGVVHYSQEAQGQAKAVQVDASRITPMAAVKYEAPAAQGSAVQDLRQSVQQAQEQQLKLRMSRSGVE